MWHVCVTVLRNSWKKISTPSIQDACPRIIGIIIFVMRAIHIGTEMSIRRGAKRRIEDNDLKNCSSKKRRNGFVLGIWSANDIKNQVTFVGALNPTAYVVGCNERWRAFKNGQTAFEPVFNLMDKGKVYATPVEEYRDLDEDEDLAMSDLSEIAANWTEVHTTRTPDNRESEPSALVCPHCHRPFGTRQHRDAHIATVHEKKRPFACRQCDKLFGQKSNLKQHVETVHEKKQPFICPQCSKTFGQKSSLNTHIATVHDKKRPFGCPQCEKTFASKRHLVDHTRTVHEKKRPFACSQCDRAFGLKTQLDKHRSSVHEKKRPYACPQCEKAFAEKQHRDKHVMTVHEKKRPFACSQCDKSFANKQNRDKHTKTVHEKKRVFACALCDKSFSAKYGVNQHMKIVHERKQPHICSHCGKAFGQKQSRDQHVRSVHQGMRPFQCNDCDYAATTKHSLDQHHKAMHTPEGQARQKKKENRLYHALQQAGVTIEQREFRLDLGCVGGTFVRVDFLVRKENCIHIIECQEGQHDYKPVQCDPHRAANIHAALTAGGNTQPVVVHMWNPDAYKIDGQRGETKYNDRVARLVKALDEPAPDRPLTLAYYFFDTHDDVLDILSDPDYPRDLKPLVCCTK